MKKANKQKGSQAFMEIVKEFAKLQLSKSGASKWGLWVAVMGVTGGLECTTIKRKKLSEVYFCEDCTLEQPFCGVIHKLSLH